MTEKYGGAMKMSLGMVFLRNKTIKKIRVSVASGSTRLGLSFSTAFDQTIAIRWETFRVLSVNEDC